MTRYLAPALAVAGLAAGCSLRSSLPIYGKVPEFTLLRENGAEFTQASVAGKVWVADFIFTTCHGPCPRMTSQMKQVADAYQKAQDVAFVSFTVDPDNDKPPVLAEYALRFKADTFRWAFVTGAKEELQKLSKDTFYLGDVGNLLEHSTRFVLIDKEGRIRGYYDTSYPGSLPELKKHIEELRGEIL